jgi:hypothetical protein
LRRPFQPFQADKIARLVCMTLLVISDIHYACTAEKARVGYELETAGRPWSRALLWAHRHYIWKRDPFAHNHLLDAFIEQAGSPDLLVANGDFSCDTAFVGVSDPAARASAHECLNRLRARFGDVLRLTLGDHELGKLSLVGGYGGLRLESWQAATRELGVPEFWRLDAGRYVLIGVASTLIGLPVFEPEALPHELETWRALRQQHLSAINAVFEDLEPDRRVILFCHDPTALPFLWRESAVQRRASQIELTVIGHLHSPLILWQSRMLAGMPHIRFLGNAIRRMSGALREARHWRPFNVRLCPALSGIELLKDGGYARIELDPDASRPARFEVQRIRWHCTCPGSGL